jgi:hypothetical protein
MVQLFRAFSSRQLVAPASDPPQSTTCACIRADGKDAQRRELKWKIKNETRQFPPRARLGTRATETSLMQMVVGNFFPDRPVLIDSDSRVL